MSSGSWSWLDLDLLMLAFAFLCFYKWGLGFCVNDQTNAEL